MKSPITQEERNVFVKPLVFFFSYHVKQSFVGKVGVFLYGGENAEDEANQDHHETATKNVPSFSCLLLSGMI